MLLKYYYSFMQMLSNKLSCYAFSSTPIKYLPLLKKNHPTINRVTLIKKLQR